jgi:hypothetical protein
MGSDESSWQLSVILTLPTYKSSIEHSQVSMCQSREVPSNLIAYQRYYQQNLLKSVIGLEIGSICFLFGYEENHRSQFWFNLHFPW